MAIDLRLAAQSPAVLHEEARRICEAAFGRRVQRVESFDAPPGMMRETVRIVLDDRTVIGTRRSNAAQGRNEALILKLLGEQGAPVPRILAYDGGWLLQEDVGTLSLRQIINDPSRTDRGSWLERALAALNRIHEAAHAAGLPLQPLPVEESRARLVRDFGFAGEVSRWLDLSVPALDERTLPRPMGTEGKNVVKGDGNPSDFIVGDDARIRLVDWEHCRAGSGLEEVARFMASPMVPSRIVASGSLAKFCPVAFDACPDPAERDAVLIVSGVGYMIRHLLRVLGWRRRGAAWGWRQSIDHGLPVIGPTAIKRLCRKGAAWAVQLPFTMPLAPWFESVESCMLAGGGKAPQDEARPPDSP